MWAVSCGDIYSGILTRRISIYISSGIFLVFLLSFNSNGSKTQTENNKKQRLPLVQPAMHQTDDWHRRNGLKVPLKRSDRGSRTPVAWSAKCPSGSQPLWCLPQYLHGLSFICLFWREMFHFYFSTSKLCKTTTRATVYTPIIHSI